MTIVVLGHDESADGTWQIDYDDASQTLAHTCTSGDKTHLQLRVTIEATQQTRTEDVSADLDQGRTVDFSNIAPSRIPPFVKGQPYPVTFGGTWS